MRIIAGKYKNQTIISPKTERTHPMSEQMRGAIFNTLGEIDGLTVLDCFAGSGAVGLEALSRDAEQVTLIDNDRAAQRAIADNIANLSVASSARLIKTGVGNWLQTATDSYDVIVADPPYNDIPLSLLPRLLEHLNPNGTLVLSWPGKQPLPALPAALILSRQYGDAQLAYYQLG